MFYIFLDEKIILDDDDDDVIVLPQEEPQITEIPDEEDALAVTANDTIITLDDTIAGEDQKESNDQQIVNGDETMEVQTQKVTTESDSVPEVKSNEPETETNGEELSAVTNEEQPAIVAQEEENKKEEEQLNYESIGNESDIQILVPQISILDLDEFEEKPIDENAAAAIDESSQASIKIKEEPKDDGYDDEDDGFEEVGTIEEPAIIDDDSGKNLHLYNFIEYLTIDFVYF